MADVHVFHVFAVFHGAAGFVGHVVNRPDGIGIRQGVIPAAYTKIHPPDHLGTVPEVLPDAGQHFTVNVAVVQNKTGAVIQYGQNPADIRFALIADGLILEFHRFVSGGDGFAEQGERIMEGNTGGGILQNGHVLNGQRTA